jgi:hypothetical protein
MPETVWRQACVSSAPDREASDQRHVPTVSIVGKDAAIFMELETGWAQNLSGRGG